MPSSAINLALEKSVIAFKDYRSLSPRKRREFLFHIASQLEAAIPNLVPIAQKETHLSPARLEGEIKRTAFQLRAYAAFLDRGLALDIRINTGNPDHRPPIPQIAKMNIPLGPVAVFGASNFPFAYSTAGGDTACALAAGCPVIEKAHPAHVETSRAVSEVIKRSISALNLPPDCFQHIEGGFETGEALVKHPLLAAVGFTGSLAGGRQIFNWGSQRETPIPVFAEMGSVNPVFLLPEILSANYQVLAQKLSLSIAQDAGQFCTNPGIMLAIASEGLENFKQALIPLIGQIKPQAMLHDGIFANFERNKARALSLKGVKILTQSERKAAGIETGVTVAETFATYFLQHPELQEEVFGAYSLLVVCETEKEMLTVAEKFKGQLTASVFGTKKELLQLTPLFEILQAKCGRFIINGVPTGVTVTTAMQHGGPYPASTDSRFSAVGGDGIRRFMRPICFQDWPDELLPPELQKANPYSLWRLVNEEWSCT